MSRVPRDPRAQVPGSIVSPALSAALKKSAAPVGRSHAVPVWLLVVLLGLELQHSESAAAANGDPVTFYTNQSAFAAAAGNLTSFDFTGVVNGSTGATGAYANAAGFTRDGVTFVGTKGDGTYSLGIQGPDFITADYNRGLNEPSLQGPAATSSFYGITNGVTTITLPGAGVTSFGIDLFDVLAGDYSGSGTDTVNLTVNTLTGSVVTPPTTGAAFLGFVSATPITSVTLTGTAAEEFPTLTNIFLSGAAAPPLPLVIDTVGGNVAPSVFNLNSTAAQASTLLFEGGILELNGGTLAGNIVAAPVTLAASNGTVDTSAGSGGFSGVVSGPGSLTVTGGGMFALTAANTYTGGTIVQAGTLSINNGSALGTGQLSLLVGTTLQAQGSFTLGNATVLTGDPTYDVPTGDTLTVTGTISDASTSPPAGAVEKIGGGTLVLDGRNTYSGGTTIGAGVLQAGNSSAIGSGPLTLSGGTLQLAAGLGVVTLANAVQVSAAGGTLDTDGSGLKLTGPVTGSGGLTLVATGGTYTGSDFDNRSVAFAGSNTYSGGTTVRFGASAQVLATNALGSGSLSIDQGGIVDLAGFSQSVSSLTGSGKLAGTGSRTGTANSLTVETFTAQSGTFSGLITAGNYFISNGNGGTTIVDFGDIQLVKASDGSASGGTLTLTGANSYRSGTLLDAGTLAIGNSSALGTGLLTMAANTTLTFTADNLTVANAIAFAGPSDPTVDTGAFDETLTGPISGPGDLTKLGSGTLTLTGTDTYTGATDVAAGTLLVDGSIANSTVTVAGGAALGGTGTIGGLVAQNGSVIAPAAAGQVGTLSVAGNVDFASGSTYQVTVAGNGQASRLAATGTAALGGAGLDVRAGTGPFTLGTTYTLLTAAGGVSGTFGTLTADPTLTAFLKPSVSYDADDVFLTLTATPFANVAVTPNQTATAAAIQALGPGSALFNAVLIQSPDGARQAFSSTSGVSHAGATTAQTEAERVVSNLIFDRLWDVGGSGIDARQLLQKLAPDTLPTLVRCYAPAPTPAPGPAGYTAWGEAFGDFGHNANGNAGSLDRSLGGFVAGVDTAVEGLPNGKGRAGFALGYTNTSFRSSSDGANGTVQSAFGSLYGGARFGSIDVRLGTTVSDLFNDARRTVIFPGFSETERSSNDGYALQGFGEVGYRLSFSHFVLEPVAGAAIIHVHQDAFSEAGGAAALNGSAIDNDVETTALGIRGEVAPISGVPLVAHGFVGWQHAFGDVNPAAILAFESEPANTFTVTGAPIDRDAAEVEASLDWRATSAFSFGLSYTGLVSANASDNAVKGRAEYRF